MRILSHFKISDEIGISLGLNLVKTVYLVDFFSASLHYGVGSIQALFTKPGLCESAAAMVAHALTWRLSLTGPLGTSLSFGTPSLTQLTSQKRGQQKYPVPKLFLIFNHKILPFIHLFLFISTLTIFVHPIAHTQRWFLLYQIVVFILPSLYTLFFSYLN